VHAGRLVDPDLADVGERKGSLRAGLAPGKRAVGETIADRFAKQMETKAVARVHALILRHDKSFCVGYFGMWPQFGALTGEVVVIGIESLIIMLVVGAIAGWLAGQIVRGFGFGLIWNMVIGIVGAFIGVWLLTQLNISPFSGFLGSIVNGTIGAVVLLVIIGLIRR
jgi:uncharacterized membrane protein YeaQ/YmgE (transglycosylase-associated protein family)